jgi:hypothetical protein
MRMPRQYRSLLLCCCTAMLFAGGAGAQVILGLPDDEPAAAAQAKLPASEAMQSGMAAIRKLVIDAHSLITHRRMAPDQARRFAAGLKFHVKTLNADPAAPVMTAVLKDIADGADQIGSGAAGDGQLDALDKIEAALTRYPQLIDDAEWKPLR